MANEMHRDSGHSAINGQSLVEVISSSRTSPNNERNLWFERCPFHEGATVDESRDFQ